MGLLLLLILSLNLAFAISLKEAEEKALSHSYQLKEAQLREIIALQRKYIKVGDLLPQVNLEFSFNLARRQDFTFSLPNLPPQRFTFIEGSFPRFNLLITQKLFDLKAFRSLDIAQSKVLLAKVETQRTLQEVLWEVRKAYLDALKAKKSKSVARAYLRMLKEHHKNVQEMYKEGLVPLKDLLETKVKLLEAQTRLKEAQTAFEKALAYLSYLTGERVRDVEDIKVEYLPLESISVEESPTLKALKVAKTLADEGTKLAKATFYPEVVLEILYQRTEETDLFPKDRYFVSFSVRWNLFSGFKRFRALEISRKEKRITSLKLQDARSKLKTLLENLRRDLKLIEEKIKVSEERLKEAKEHLRVAREKYAEGLGSNAEVLEAQSYVVSAMNTLESAKIDYLKKVFEIYRITGMGHLLR